MKGLEAVVIGASAGGVSALFEVLARVPRGQHPPVVCLLHLPPDRDSQLSEVLAGRLRRPVQEARDKAPVVPGFLYVAGPGYHLSIERSRRFSLSQEPSVHHSRPAIDYLFESAADTYGVGLMGILLTGANEDGAQGLAAIHRSGGRTVVQDPRDAQVALMPEAALALHTPDHLLPLTGIGQLLATLEPCAC